MILWDNLLLAHTVSNQMGRDAAVEMGLVKRVQQLKAAAGHQGMLKTELMKIHLPCIQLVESHYCSCPNSKQSCNVWRNRV